MHEFSRSSESGESHAWPVTRRSSSTRGLRMLDSYRLLEHLGSGATSEVYRAEHVELGRQVALKLLHPELSDRTDYVQRLCTEGRATNLVNSDHIAQVHDFRRASSGETYLVMELLEGCDLAHAFRKGLGVATRLRALGQLCDALMDVHAAGIVHRDLKPENVFLVLRNGLPFVKLLDFGIARLCDGGGDSLTSTQPGMVVGTPCYMAPEQATASPVDHRCDLHAVGVMLFEALTGRTPFTASSVHAMLREVAAAEPPSLRDCAEIPHCIRRDAERLVADCLQKNPRKRPRDAAEIRKRLDTMIAALERGRERASRPRPAAGASVASAHVSMGSVVLGGCPEVGLDRSPTLLLARPAPDIRSPMQPGGLPLWLSLALATAMATATSATLWASWPG